MVRFLTLAIAIAILGATSANPTGAQRKLEALESGKVRRGSTVVFTEAELNEYARAKLPEFAPTGARDPKLQLGSGSATGSIIVDFAKLRRAPGHEPGWLLTHLIGGEKRVLATVRVNSAQGKATVTVERLEIAGIVVTGATLDFLLEAFVRPVFPQAKINQPFALHDGIDRIEVQPGQARAIMRR